MTQTLLDRARYGAWAVIAGGSDGTGAAFAHEIAAAGLNILLVARRKALLDSLAAELRATYGVEVRSLVQDLNAPDAALQMAHATEGLEVGLYVSNAGAESGGHAFLDTQLDTNLRAHRPQLPDRFRGMPPFRQSHARPRARRHHSDGLRRRPGRPARCCRLFRGEGLRDEFCRVTLGRVARPRRACDRHCGTDHGNSHAAQHALGNLDIPGIVPAAAVVRTALQRLPEGCSYIYAFGEPPEANEQQTAVRRARVLAVERISQSLFS